MANRKNVLPNNHENGQTSQAANSKIVRPIQLNFQNLAVKLLIRQPWLLLTLHPV